MLTVLDGMAHAHHQIDVLILHLLASRLEGLVTHPLVDPERAYVVSHKDRHERVPAGNDRTVWRPIFAKVTHNCTVPCTHRSKVSREWMKIDILCFYLRSIGLCDLSISLMLLLLFASGAVLSNFCSLLFDILSFLLPPNCFN